MLAVGDWLVLGLVVGSEWVQGVGGLLRLVPYLGCSLVGPGFELVVEGTGLLVVDTP